MRKQSERDSEIVEIFDNILFKGKSHLKCRIGITVITDKLFVHWDYELTKLKNMVKELFIKHFRNNIDIHLVNDELLNDELLNDEKNEECFDIIPIKRKKIKQINIV